MSDSFIYKQKDGWVTELTLNGQPIQSCTKAILILEVGHVPTLKLWIEPFGDNEISTEVEADYADV